MVDTNEWEFWFQNNCWCSISLISETKGGWEWQQNEEDEESYLEGGLYFDGKILNDYDGCFNLPSEVISALTFLGYVCEDFESQDA